MNKLRGSIKPAIRYQEGINSGSVFDYYHKHYNMKLMLKDGEVYNRFMELGFTPKDLSFIKDNLLD